MACHIMSILCIGLISGLTRWRQSCTHAWLGKGGTIHFHWSSCIACSWGPYHRNLRRFEAAVMSISPLQTFMGICLKMVPFFLLIKGHLGTQKGHHFETYTHISGFNLHIPGGGSYVNMVCLDVPCQQFSIDRSNCGFGVWSSCSWATTQAQTAQRKGIMAFLKSTVGDSGGDHAWWIYDKDQMNRREPHSPMKLHGIKNIVWLPSPNTYPHELMYESKIRFPGCSQAVELELRNSARSRLLRTSWHTPAPLFLWLCRSSIVILMGLICMLSWVLWIYAFLSDFGPFLGD